jgi:hypothetical protein
MQRLVSWIDANITNNAVVVAAVAHHELTAIHPYKDGNGRVSRLLMNLILLKSGYPICNIKVDDRPRYFDSLAFADIGIHDAIVRMVFEKCDALFAEYVRLRTETKRMAEWATRWGNKEAEVLQRREARQLELWQSRIKQVFLEFQTYAELLDDNLEQLDISFYDYKSEGVTFEKYQELLENGFTEHANAFVITFSRPAEYREDRKRFMFRYYRNFAKFPRNLGVIPLELNYFDSAQGRYVRLGDLPWADRVRIRELYYAKDGEFVIRYFDVQNRSEKEQKPGSISEAVKWFFDDILQHIFGYSH